MTLRFFAGFLFEKNRQGAPSTNASLITRQLPAPAKATKPALCVLIPGQSLTATCTATDERYVDHIERHRDSKPTANESPKSRGAIGFHPQIFSLVAQSFSISFFHLFLLRELKHEQQSSSSLSPRNNSSITSPCNWFTV